MDRVLRRGALPPDAGCWMYFLSSPLIAGAIVFFGVGSTKSGGDYCDPIYATRAERDADYRTASLVIDISSLVMLAIGAAAVITLIHRRQTMARRRGLRVALGVAVGVVALSAYLFLLLGTSDFTSDCG